MKVAPPQKLSEAVVLPLVDYFKRKGALEVLAFILLYKLGDVMMGIMTTPFVLDIGFTKTEIGTVTKGFGLVATILGTLTGGALMTRLGMKRSLWLFGFLQSITIACFMLLAHLGHDYPAMVTSIAVENITGGMGNAAFTAFMMSLCNKRFTATQYALLTSLMAVSRNVMGYPCGVMAKSLGWTEYFFICILFALPGMLLLLRFNRWNRETLEVETAS